MVLVFLHAAKSKLCFAVSPDAVQRFCHATYGMSSGKIEGINNKIKTLRRQGYGYPDDDYFFLKLFDLSRAEMVRNPKSHRKSD